MIYSLFDHSLDTSARFTGAGSNKKILVLPTPYDPCRAMWCGQISRHCGKECVCRLVASSRQSFFFFVSSVIPNDLGGRGGQNGFPLSFLVPLSSSLWA